MEAVTVRGALPADVRVGLVLPHEYLVFDLAGRYSPSSSLRMQSLRDAPITLERLAEFRAHPLRSLVNLRSPPLEVLAREIKDCAAELADSREGLLIVDAAATAEEGRDPEALLALSERTGVHIVMSTGLRAQQAAATPTAEDAEAEDELLTQLADLLVAELRVGVEVRRGVRVCAGVLSLGIPLCPPISLVHTRLFRALARAQTRTGAPIVCAAPAARAASPGDAPEAVLEALRAFVTYGAVPGQIIVTHAQHLLSEHGDAGALRVLLREGFNLTVDGIGNSWSIIGAQSCEDELALPISEEIVARSLATLVDEGFGGQIMLSHCVSSQLQLRSAGGGGYAHLQRFFFPRLRRLGIGDAAILQMTQSNAMRLLQWKRPAGPPSRLMKAWSCDACHRTFEETVNPSDVQPGDRMYYEKFSFRYCSTVCLGNHRKAAFVQPFHCQAPE
ncbi:hypothetical protein AB1Y20_015296 [Prymnesium parvum]|uniref:Vms1-associating treble clef domain-containing protein n=1 Tax=Prymnesium parvum TaxID=97485 RepID=A0AB34K133_PRYPA